MKWTCLLLLVLICGCAQLVQAQTRFESVYTDLRSRNCKTIERDAETGASVQRCPGIGGYDLLVLDDDARQSITVVAPGGKKYDLDYWRVITHAFSSVSLKAEWRGIKKPDKFSPLALIVRVNANEDVDNPQRVTSYLAVAKITPETICVTHRIPRSLKANEEARRAAEVASTTACLGDLAP